MPTPLRNSHLQFFFCAKSHLQTCVAKQLPQKGQRFELSDQPCLIVFFYQGTGQEREENSIPRGRLALDSHHSSQCISLAMENRPGWNTTSVFTENG